MGAFYAHTPSKDDPEQRWHELAEHARCVARLAAEHAEAFGSERAGWWVGILHDAGKASEKFQDYLKLCAAEPNRRHPSTDHKGAGVLRSVELFQSLTLAVLIQGHHGGLLDSEELSVKWKDHLRHEEELRVALERYDTLELIPADTPPLAIPEFALESPRATEFWLRMLFSALVDADHFDTERFRQPDASALRGSPAGIAELWEEFKRDQAGFVARLSPEQNETAVNQVRAEVYAACLAAAEGKPGFYRLTVPTGGGKTRSGLGFALRHAVANEQRRIILAVPYLTITDQTARIVRSIFPDQRVVLEHHSAAGVMPDDEEGSQEEREVWRRLAAQDWDAPLIITTMVQLFESLLGRRTGVCRKLHRIAGSVIVLDEAQTIPLTLREPIYDVLRELVANYGVTVVLCTATQPALDTMPDGIAPVQIVPDVDAERHFRALERVRYVWPEPGVPAWSWEEAAEATRSSDQTLAIVNTVADAAALFSALGEGEGHFHLSSRMCGAHRRDVVDQVRTRLAEGLPCRLVSTQVVEAGVDLDFPLLLRAFGPLDRIVQAAGRCNREGKLPGGGTVLIFEPAEGGMPPGPYRIGAQRTERFREMEGTAFDLNDPTIFERYFRQLGSVVLADGPKVQQARERFDFETVADTFRMIDDADQGSVLVRYRGLDWDPIYGETAPVDELVRHIELAVTSGNSAWLRGLLRKAQPYLVNVRTRNLDEFERSGDVHQLTDGLWLWLPECDPALGLVSGRMDVETLIVV